MVYVARQVRGRYEYLYECRSYRDEYGRPRSDRIAGESILIHLRKGLLVDDAQIA